MRQLLNVAGAAPCWVDFAGVVIEDNWEQPLREKERGECFAHVYASVRVRETRPYDSRVYIYVRFMYVTFMDQYVRGGNTERKRERNSWVPHQHGLFAVLIYINIRL